MRIFAIYDVKADQWMTPFFSQTNGTAMREVSMHQREHPEAMIAVHAADFEMYVVGDFTEGVLSAVPKTLLGTLAEVA